MNAGTDSKEPETPASGGGVVRYAISTDHPAIVALNAGSVEETSHMDGQKLALLSSAASYLRVYALGAVVEGFLLGFREGARYENENFAWFRQRFPRFVYIDRVVVRDDRRGSGIGSALYADLEHYAKASDVGLLTCEVNVRPANLPSLKFHRKRGFVEVGTRDIVEVQKIVSMQVKRLDAAGGAQRRAVSLL